MPHSVPNMMAHRPVLRHPPGLQHPLALPDLGHSQSMAHIPSDQLSQTQRSAAQHHFISTMPTEWAAQLGSRSPSPFELTSKEGTTHFGEQVTALPHFGADGISHDMGLMDSDMLDMLLKPE